MTTPTITDAIRWNLMPAAVRAAFCAAHEPSDVAAALRFHRRMTGEDATGYLNGCLIPLGWRDDEMTFRAICDDAHGIDDAEVA